MTSASRRAPFSPQAASSPLRYLLVVLDGAGDRPTPALNNRTPLEAAHLPALNSLARSGRVGLSEIARGIAPESDTGVLAVLGIPPFSRRPGRGALEALGARERVTPRTLSLRANFATADATGTRLLDRRVGRSLKTEEARELAHALTSRVRLPGVRVRFISTAANRGVLLLDGPGLSKAVSNTDPAYAIRHGVGHARNSFPNRVLASKATANSAAAAKTAALVNEFTRQAHALFEAHAVNARRKKNGQVPANAVLLRDADVGLPAPQRRYRDWTILADMPLELGVGAYLGMRVLPLHPAQTPAGYRLRAQKALAALRSSRGVYVHIKGPDLFGHDGNARGKRACLEEIDAHFFRPLLAGLDRAGTRILVTSDHATPCALKAHGTDAVPYLLAGPGFRAEGRAFTEREGKRGAHTDAARLLPTLLKK